MSQPALLTPVSASGVPDKILERERGREREREGERERDYLHEDMSDNI